MPKKGASKIVETNGSAVTVTSDATAIGDSTLTSVKSDVVVTKSNHVTKMQGTVVTVAAAESTDGDAPIATTMTDVSFAGVDKAIVKTKHKTIEDDGVVYDVTITKFKARDSDRKDGNADIKYITHDKTGGDIDAHLDGNLATVGYNAQAHGQDSLVVVDAYALALEDQLSVSTLVVTAAVG